MALKQIIYTSVSKTRLLDDEVESIISAGQACNTAHDITGLLLFDGCQFFQLLEGPEGEVDDLYHRIQQDSRHHSVTALIERRATSRLFPGCSLSYKRVASFEGLESMIDDHEKSTVGPLAMMKQLADSSQRNSQTSSGERQWTVLIVDDDPTSVRVLTKILSAEYCIRVAPTGEAALSAIEERVPDLILLDIGLPDFSGFEVCAQLKMLSRSREVPIIFVSAQADTGHKVTGLNLGGCDYITKPYRPEEIRARIHTHLEVARLKIELEASNRQLFEKNRRLDLFARGLAHDLRGPLTVIMGFSTLLLQQVGTLEEATLIDSLRRIQSAGSGLNETIEALLLLATSEHQSVEMKAVESQAVAETSRDDLSDMIAEYGGRISFEEDLPPCLAHAPWLRRVLVNLFSNGLKYGGRPPHIHLSCDSVGDHTATYRVRDNGKGLNDAEIGKLFNEFTRLSPDVAPGIGLGLILVKSLIGQMGGRIQVESSPDEGTSFLIQLPVALGSEAACSRENRNVRRAS